MRTPALLFAVLVLTLAPARQGSAQSNPASAAMAARLQAWADAIAATIDVAALRGAASRPDGSEAIGREVRNIARLITQRYLEEIQAVAKRSAVAMPALDLAALANTAAEKVDIDEFRQKLARSADVSAARAEVASMTVFVLATVSDALAQAFQKNLARARLDADEGLAASLATTAAFYYAKHDGKWPSSKEALKQTFLQEHGRPVEFRCPGNDIDYNPATGKVRLLIDDAARCGQ